MFNLTIYLKNILLDNHLKQTQSIYKNIKCPLLVYTPYNWAIRKTNPDGSLAWVAALSLDPIIKSLSIDTLEQYVYVGSRTNPLDVVRLGAGTGAIVDAQRQ